MFTVVVVAVVVVVVVVIVVVVSLFGLFHIGSHYVALAVLELTL